MSYKGFVNPTNHTSTELTRKVRSVSRPTMRTIGKWREEWVQLGYDYKMTFQSYKKRKCIEWHKNCKKQIKLRNKSNA